MLETIGVIAAFTLIIVLVNKHYPLYAAMFVSSAVLALSSEKKLTFLIDEAIKAAVARDSIELAAVVLCISVLSRIMKVYGMLDDMSDSISRLLKSVKPAVMLIPAFIGMMPVLGGAVVSAPMIDKLGDMLGMDPARKSASNLVFRHTLFFVYPFSTSLILSSKLTGIPITGLIKALWPTAVTLVIAGYYFYLRPMKEVGGNYEPARWRQNLMRLFVSMSPIVVAILLAMVVKLPLWASMIGGIVIATFLCMKKPGFTLRTAAEGADWKLALSMVAIMVFKAMIQNVSFITRMVSAIRDAGVPVAVMAFVLSLVIGLVAASQTTTLSIAFPLLLPIIPAGDAPLAYVTLIYIASFVSYFVSPLHMCAVLTNDYFRCRLSESSRECLPVMAVASLLSIGLFFLYR